MFGQVVVQRQKPAGRRKPFPLINHELCWAKHRHRSSAMPRQRKSDLDFLRDHLKLLLFAGEAAKKTHPEVYNTFGAWTTLKLVCVAYWQSVYSTIIPDHLSSLHL